MSKRQRLDDPDDEATPTSISRRRRRITTSVEPASTEAVSEPTRSKYVNGESDRLGGNFLLAKTDGGYRNAAGRPIGRPNVVTVTLKRAIMLAAEDVGEDGKGKDGLQGYLRRLALIEPQAFTSLLRRILPQQVQTSVDPQSALGQILEAARARLKFEKNKTIDATPSIPFARGYSFTTQPTTENRNAIEPDLNDRKDRSPEARKARIRTRFTD